MPIYQIAEIRICLAGRNLWDCVFESADFRISGKAIFHCDFDITRFANRDSANIFCWKPKIASSPLPLPLRLQSSPFTIYISGVNTDTKHGYFVLLFVPELTGLYRQNQEKNWILDGKRKTRKMEIKWFTVKENTM